MTIFRCELLVLAAFAAIPQMGATAQQSTGVSCDNIDPNVQGECVNKRVEAKERRLAAVYPQALAAARRNFARYGNWDNRSDPTHLVQSQAAWKQFVEHDCKLQAAFGGGSNSSISDRETACHEDALDKRIEFLEELADGSFGTG